MVPHVFGWFTMTSVWFILFTQLEHARRDISEVSDRNIPEWVFAAIIGTSIIFMSFAFVRRARSNRRLPRTHARARAQSDAPLARGRSKIVFQRLAPGFYWGTEIAFCILSLTAKMYLGWFLLINVIYVDGSADETLRATNNEVR